MTTARQERSLRDRLNSEAGLRSRVLHLLRVARALPDYLAIKKAVEARGLDELRKTHGAVLTGESPALAKGKYLRPAGYLRRDLSRAVELGLHRSAPLRLLDLGSGAGYFLFVCKYFGHRAVGVDIEPQPDEPRDRRLMHRFYADMIATLGVERRFWTIRSFEPLPDLDGEPFHVVTAHQASFHRDNLAAPWGVAEWRFFLDDIGAKMAPGGRLVMMLNPDLAAGQLVAPEVRSLFETSGATVSGWTVSLSWSS